MPKHLLPSERLRIVMEGKKQEDKEKESKHKDKEKSKKSDKKSDEPKRDEVIFNAIVAGKQAMIVNADRATDLLALIKLKERFKLKLAIRGAADAVLVTEQLVKADIPVLINATRNLPGSFDSLHASLSNAATLTAAGVKVALISADAHNLYQLRYDAGNAVANGLTKAQALASVTSNIADIFGLNSGRIAVGKNADLVLWSADPFELSTKVVKMWIGGDEYSTISRQDALRNRYTTDSELPRAYIK